MRRFRWPVVAALAVAACTSEIPSPDDDPDPDDPAACAQARTYTNFGGAALEADRLPLAAGSDRMQVKPFRALAAEYARALGLASFDTGAFAATFGQPPARWHLRPAATANTLYGAFALAFDACKQHTATNPAYASAPTAEAADPICRDHARRAWSREATDAEVTSCVNFAVNQTDPADGPRVRWAYSCAAVFSASGFLAY